MDITADDLWPLVAKLSPEERIRLVRIVLLRSRAPASAARGYDGAPVGQEEFSQDDDGLAWEAEGWDDVR